MKNIQDYTETELKALAYDNFAIIERSQASIKNINEELQRRQNLPKAETEVDRDTPITKGGTAPVEEIKETDPAE